MVVLLKTASVWVSFIQIMQVRVKNKGRSVWKSRYNGVISDPREGPSLARRTTQDLLGSGLTRLAREGRRDQGKGHLARFL